MEMTAEIVRRRVQDIRECAGDDEAAHSMEDQLHQDVLQSIADFECDSPYVCAKLALETKAIDFARWCA